MSSYDYSTPSEQDFVPRRNLPRPPPPPGPRRPYSRPLPQIPRALACKQCRTCITSSNALLPLSAIPPASRSFKGFSGKASLFVETYNVKLARPGVQLMATGAHTMQEISCSNCSSYLGWKIVRAHERSERWKEGNCLLELENLQQNSNTLIAYEHPGAGMSSDSDSSECSF